MREINPMDTFLIDKGIARAKDQLDFVVLNEVDNVIKLGRREYEDMVNESLDHYTKQLKLKKLIEEGEFTFRVISASDIARDLISAIRTRLRIEEDRC